MKDEHIVRVFGIDPAPTKGMAVFDGEDRHISIPESRSFIDTLKTESNLLVCWDSPLTGPPLSVVEGGLANGSAFSQRPIEGFFSQAQTGFKTPHGISVRLYSGCPHWALSRSLFGLPRTGPFDMETLPFRLISGEDQQPTSGQWIAEVHPALALWLWCRKDRELDASWAYKQDAVVRRNLWNQLLQVPVVSRALSPTCPVAPSSDDVLDARVAYALGHLRLHEPQSVVVLGNLDTGTFLLPKVDGLVEAFRAFTQKFPGKHLKKLPAENSGVTS